MLSIFPDLLFLAPLATTIIRIALGLLLLYFACATVFTKRQTLVQHLVPHGRLAAISAPWLLGFSLFVTGGLLLIGLFTQIAAIVGAYFFLTLGIIDSGTEKVFQQSWILYGTLAIISLTLLLSGAGYFAFDLPL